MKKTKIIRVIARLNIGGPAVHTILLNEGLAKDDFDVSLITGSPEAYEGDMAYLAVEKGVEVVFIPELGRSIKLFSDVAALWKLIRIFKKEKPDIVHTHTAKAGSLGRAAAVISGVPIKVHSFHGHVFHSYFGPFKTALVVYIERLLALFTDRIVVVSDIIKHDICGRFRIAENEKVSVIRLGLDLDSFRAAEGLKGRLRKELNIDKDTILAGIVGRLTAIKNHSLLFEAIRLIKPGIPASKIQFLIIGDGELRSELEGRCGELGIKEYVRFIGWRRDLPEVYADLDIVVSTSLNEGTPVSLIEAMASKKAVVSTRVGGVPDLVEDKKTGILVGSGDPLKLKEAIALLYMDEPLRKRLGEAGSVSVYERYSKARLVKDMEGLYRGLLLKKGIT